MSRNKAKKLMKEAGVLVKHRKKFKVTTDSNHTKPLFDNVRNRNFASKGPDQAYVQDIKYIWTQEGWLYLAKVSYGYRFIFKARCWLEHGIKHGSTTV